jgi:hypothetical protein
VAIIAKRGHLTSALFALALFTSGAEVVCACVVGERVGGWDEEQPDVAKDNT